MPKPHSFFLPESYPDPLPTPDAPTADAPNPHPDLLPDSLFAPGVVRFASFNNLYKVDVLVKGEGIPLQLELKDPDQAFLDFGIVSVGGDVTKTVPLINNSKKPVTFKLRPSDAS